MSPCWTRSGGLYEVSPGADAAGVTGSLLAVAVDCRGKAVLTARQEVSVAPAGETEVTVRLPLASGDYEVRVGVEIPASNSGGSVYGYVTVPKV